MTVRVVKDGWRGRGRARSASPSGSSNGIRFPARSGDPHPGGITAVKREILRKADAVFLEEIRNADLYRAIWQAFTVLLPVRGVSVMGDARSYNFCCTLGAVTSTDGKTAAYSRSPTNSWAALPGSP
jgi:hypothetical protein